MFLPIPSQFVSHKGFHQCVNHKKKLTLRHPSPTFGSFSFFQASIGLGVDKLLQELTKSYKNELRHLLQCYILIPRKCLRKTISTHSALLLPYIKSSPKPAQLPIALLPMGLFFNGIHATEQDHYQTAGPVEQF